MFETNIRPYSNIYKAVVVAVNTSRGTCDLRTKDTETRLLEDVPWASPFADLDGNGIDFCPVEDQYCYVLESTSNSQERRAVTSVIIGWCFPEVNGAFGDGRERLNRNDIKLSNRRGAKVLLDANRGDLLVQSGPSCGITLYRMSNFLHMISDSYQLDTLGGSVAWDTLGEGQAGDKVRYSANIKSSAGDEVGFLRVLASSDQTGDFFQVRVTGPSADSGQFEVGNTSDLLGSPSQYANIRFGSDGEGVIHTANRLSLSANDAVNITTKNKVETDARVIGGRCHGEESNSFSDYFVDPENGKIVCDFATVEATEVIITNRTNGEVLFRTADDTLHDDSQNKRLFNEDLAEWLFNHTHPTPSGQSLPPVGGPTDVPIKDPDNGEEIEESDRLTAIKDAEANQVVMLQSLITLSTLMEQVVIALNFLGGSLQVQAAITQLGALGILTPANGNVAGLFALMAVQRAIVSDQINSMEENSSVSLDPNTNDLVSALQSFGLATVADVMTKDTKVR